MEIARTQLREMEKQFPYRLRTRLEIELEREWARSKLGEIERQLQSANSTEERLMHERRWSETSGYIAALSWVLNQPTKNKATIKKESKRYFFLLLDISFQFDEDQGDDNQLSQWKRSLFEANGYCEGLSWTLGGGGFIQIREKQGTH